VGFAQNALTVNAVLQHLDGHLEQVQAPWIIDAEGAHSVLRTTLDLPFEGRTFDKQYALGDLSIDSRLSESDWHLFSTGFGFFGVFPLGHGEFRIIASTAPNQETAPTLELLQTLYNQRSPIPAQLKDLRWSSWFRINSRMLHHLRIGRVLVGGDAAHIHSPAAGQGMNTGIQDMINLAWKLALVIRKQAPETLLDTYEKERLPVIRNVLRKTEKITNMMGSTNPLVQLLIYSFTPLLERIRRVKNSIPIRISQTSISYRDSPLSVQHGYTGKIQAGDRVPDLVVQTHNQHDSWQEHHLHYVLDPSKFTLLILKPDTASKTSSQWYETVRPWESLIDVIEIAPVSGNKARQRFQVEFGRFGGILLIRPDSYVGFAGDQYTSVQNLRNYCKRWLTQKETYRKQKTPIAA
jgi:hypothetical protein